MWITRLTQKIESWASVSKFGYWLTTHYYRDVIQKEIDLAQITASDHILFIGGGICPCSAILLHQATGAKVTAIDNNRNCTSKAQELIEHLKLREHVQVLYQDGRVAELEAYSVVHFALQVSPLEAVFSQVEKRALSGTKLLIRRPRKSLNKIYPLPSASLPICDQQVTHKKARNIGRTLLYIK